MLPHNFLLFVPILMILINSEASASGTAISADECNADDGNLS